jgi:hypothetical protein
MEMVKKISARILLLLIIVIVSNYLYKYTFYKQDVIDNSLLTGKLQNGIENSDILFFSASPNKAYPKEDKDRRSISKILDDILPKYSVTSIDTGAIHAGVYKKLIQLIPNDNNLKYVVVNMNYRSFGVLWMMSSLENAIAKQSVFYANRPILINRFLQGLNYYEAISKNERQFIIQQSWRNKTLPYLAPKDNVKHWCATEKWGHWTNPKRGMADHYIKNYAFVIDESNQRIKDFDEIVEICKSKKIKLIYNVLGENIENAKYLVDSDLTNLMLDNKNYLIERYSSKGVIMVDNFDKIPDSCFYERDFPTEHYSFTGRAILAENIAKEITKLN